MADLPKTRTAIKTEATRFRSAVSESLLQAMGGDINYLLASILPVGSVVHSMLTEAQFQDESSTDWVLADGRGVGGSAYALITGNSTIPDLRGVFIRGKNNGRDGSSGNPNGEHALGTYETDGLAPHTHATSISTRLVDTAGAGDIVKDEGSEFQRIDVGGTGANSGTDTRPRSVTLNPFIRIN